MPILSITIDQMVEMIENMTEGEKETLLIKMDKAFYGELKKRVKEIPDITKSGKALSMKEVFENA
jgi:FKBP-type peptidyl-prolyl cis-trans isomerase 2